MAARNFDELFGRLEAAGFGLDDNRDRARPVLNVGLRGAIAFEVAGPLSLLGGVGGYAPLIRDDFFYTAADGRKAPLFTMSPVVGTAEAGLGVNW